MIRVFVSSVAKGLENTREQINADLRKAGYEVSAMEDFGAQVDIPIDVCIREARKADVVVLIIGPRYGSLLPSGISYTHAEFREARGAGIPVLAFRVPDGEVSEEEKERISDFLTEVGSTTTFDSLLSTDYRPRFWQRLLLQRTRVNWQIGFRSFSHTVDTLRENWTGMPFLITKDLSSEEILRSSNSQPLSTVRCLCYF